MSPRGVFMCLCGRVLTEMAFVGVLYATRGGCVRGGSGSVGVTPPVYHAATRARDDAGGSSGCGRDSRARVTCDDEGGGVVAMGGGKQKRVSSTGKVIPKSVLKQKKGTSKSAASRYVTRNQALNRLQLKLGDFRRLCILKGIHPREPKKKSQGQGKTYYHVKDIAFLHHEPLLEKFRELRRTRAS